MVKPVGEKPSRGAFMKAAVGRVVFTISFLLAASLCAGKAEEGQVHVDLGSVVLTATTDKESLVLLPLSLLAGPDAEIVKIQTEIIFPNTYLSFSRGLAKSQEVKIEATVSENPEDLDKSRLLVVVFPAGSSQSIRPGIFADLEFKVSQYVPDGAIELPHRPKAYSASHLLAEVEGQPGLITVTTPIVACFFYMH
ncbi:MAG: hypothetical protein HY644_03660 [Acidobacteria bacterium]|nr:hypothetical protein [Acidobacteriota bacterium]